MSARSIEKFRFVFCSGHGHSVWIQFERNMLSFLTLSPLSPPCGGFVCLKPQTAPLSFTAFPPLCSLFPLHPINLHHHRHPKLLLLSAHSDLWPLTSLPLIQVLHLITLHAVITSFRPDGESQPLSGALSPNLFSSTEKQKWRWRVRWSWTASDFPLLTFRFQPEKKLLKAIQSSHQTYHHCKKKNLHLKQPFAQSDNSDLKMFS